MILERLFVSDTIFISQQIYLTMKNLVFNINDFFFSLWRQRSKETLALHLFQARTIDSFSLVKNLLIHITILFLLTYNFLISLILMDDFAFPKVGFLSIKWKTGSYGFPRRVHELLQQAQLKTFCKTFFHHRMGGLTSL